MTFRAGVSVGRNEGSVPRADVAPAGSTTELVTRGSETGPARAHLAFLDGVRGFAALYVVLHHVWLTSYPGFPRDTGPFWAAWMMWGQLAVSVFIVVSGFSLALAPMRSGDVLTRGFGNYIRRRAFRILPPYWAALALSCAVVVLFTGAHTGQRVDAKAVLVHSVLLQDVVNSAKPNGAFWSIAVEWQIYFLFPVLLLIWRKAGGAAMVAVTTFAVVASYLAGSEVGPLSKVLDLTPQFLALFAFGVAAAHILLVRGRLSRVPWARVGLGLVAATVVVLVWWGPALVEARYFWVDMLAGAAAAALFAGWAQHPTGRSAQFFGSRVPRWLGQSSYSLYLVHLPILGLVYYGLVVHLTDANSTSFLLLLLLGVPAAVVGSRLFWWWFERPFVRHRTIRELRGAWRRPHRAGLAAMDGVATSIPYLRRRRNARDAARDEATRPRAGGRFPHVDAMRAIAALSVVLYHTGVIGGLAAAGILGPYVSHLNMGVCLFFVISGFLLYRPFVSARLAGARPVQVGPYLARRALRILPGYWFALTVLAILFHLPGVFTADWWRFYGLVQIYNPRTIDQGMGVAWTLCIEATFYLFLPVFDVLVSKISARRADAGASPRADVIALAVVSGASLIFVFTMYLHGAAGWATLNLLGTFDWFALGMAVAVLTVVRPQFRYWHPAAFWSLALLAFVAVTRLDTLDGRTWLFQPLQHIGYGLVSVLLFVPAVMNRSGLVGRVLSLRPLAWTGMISYSVYLFHASLIPPLRDRSGGQLLPGSGWVSLTVVALAVVLPVAAVNYHVVERRAPELVHAAVRKARAAARGSGRTGAEQLELAEPAAQAAD
jgi:peptidoglycan/LPS O-acetylase OafA/YrhL